MADLPQQNTIIQYIADGVTTNYVVPFYVPVETDGTPDIDVYTQAQDAEPVPESDIKTWSVDYTYTENSDPITGGYITFLPGKIPANGYVVTIVRNVSASLNVEFSNAQTFSGITLDAALDKLLLITQQNKSYAFDRNLSYIVNSYLPEDTILSNVQIPVLGDNQVWFGSAGGVIAATLEQGSDVSTLRSELANEQPVTNGAALVGFYDETNMTPTNVADQLNYLTGAVTAPLPAGMIIDFGGTSAPSGFLVCDGSEVSRATYTNLFSAIGETWGAGNGTTTFNLPSLSRRVTMGSGGSSTSIIGNAVGDTCSDEETTLTNILQIPSHNHTATTTTTTTFTHSNVASGSLNRPVYGSANSGSGSLPGVSTTTIANTGGSMPFNITQASAIVLKIIKT